MAGPRAPGEIRAERSSSGGGTDTGEPGLVERCVGSCLRCVWHVAFFIRLFVSFCKLVAPAALAVFDVAAHTLLFFSVGRQPVLRPWITVERYHFTRSLFDVVCCAIVRGSTMLVAYGCSSRGAKYYGYEVAATVMCAGSLGLIALKASTFRYSGEQQFYAPFIFSVFVVFALLHVLLAHSYVAEAKRRKLILRGAGLLGGAHGGLWSGSETDEEAGEHGLGGEGSASVPLLGGALHSDLDADQPTITLTDADSRFMQGLGAARVTVHYKFTAPPTPEPTRDAVLLLHGFASGTFAWRNLMMPLAAQTGANVIAFDRTGSGLSAKPERPFGGDGTSPYALEAQARVAVDLLERLGAARVVIVGHDDGSLLGLMVNRLLQSALEAGGRAGSSEAPIRPLGVALLGANLSGSVVPSSTRLLLSTRLGLDMLRPLLRSEIGEVATRKAWADRSKLTREVIELYKQPLRAEGWDRSLAEMAHAHKEVSRGEREAYVRAAASRPVLVVCGVQDRVTRPPRSEALAAEVGASARLALLPECGHLPHEETPDALLAELVPFVSRCLQAS